MRIYVLSAGDDGWSAFAPEVPGLVPGTHKTREGAIAACRAIAGEERAAFERLGGPLDSSSDEVIGEWDRPIWQFPEFLTPVRPAVRDAALARMAELEEQIDGVLARLSDEEWGRRYGDGWTVRAVVDHLANGCGLFIRRLEPWPLDPEEAQRSAAADLRRGLDEHTDRPFVVDHFGSNLEGVRIRWTPRKVFRVVRRLQDAWLAHAARGDAQPTLRQGVPFSGNEDAPGDDAPLSADETRALTDVDAELRRAAAKSPAVRTVALSYRHFRDRLLPWPADSLARWRATRLALRRFYGALDETRLAAVLIAPNGLCDSVGLVQSLAIGHLRDHHAQIGTALAPSGQPSQATSR